MSRETNGKIVWHLPLAPRKFWWYKLIADTEDGDVDVVDGGESDDGVGDKGEAYNDEDDDDGEFMLMMMTWFSAK